MSALAPEPAAMEPTDTPAVEYSIDDLAAVTGVPSRTIRFYQSAGALPKPEIRGRKAFYTPAHVERLQLIGRLQDRGLRIRAIRDVTSRIDKGELGLGEWLGLEERLHEPWSDEEPHLLSEEALKELLGERRAGLAAELVRHGLLERKGRSWLAPHPTLLQTVLALQDRGVALDVTTASLGVVRRHVARMADELVALYVKSIGDGFGATDAANDVAEAVASVRSVGIDAVRAVFAEEMQRALRSAEVAGKVARGRR